MARANQTFHAEGLEKVNSRFARMRIRASDAAPALEAVGEVFLKEEDRRWGKGWKPNAPETVAQKGNAAVGELTGDLKRSLTKRDSKYSRLIATRDVLQFGTFDPVANIFNSGKKDKTQPRRKLIRIYKKARVEASQIIAKWMAEVGDR